MNEEEVKKYVGKKCLIILNNSFKYTAIIPIFSGESFTIVDKYDKHVTINCDFIAMIQEEA